MGDSLGELYSRSISAKSRLMFNQLNQYKTESAVMDAINDMQGEENSHRSVEWVSENSNAMQFQNNSQSHRSRNTSSYNEISLESIRKSQQQGTTGEIAVKVCHEPRRKY